MTHCTHGEITLSKKSEICSQQQKREILTQAQLMIHDLLELRVI